MNAYTRKKQPLLIRRALLDCAAQVAMERGVGGVTMQAVADAVGVTKGGLFHHFPNKQALIEGMFTDLLERLDAEIDTTMAQDPHPCGSFTRAYVNSIFTGPSWGLQTLWSALFMSAMTEPALRQIWSNWIAARMLRHRETDNSLHLYIIRLAADGAWLAFITSGEAQASSELLDVQARLLEQTATPYDTDGQGV
ncbi:TetR/AcrR family transcriptional regulator [Castellaniella sp.]|uniref:TetR/AcrR family transcriptional regulator n=1 Tax=Castellaniella sp. TaxID=1955812 RepID=UPI002AFEE360|nr:TetR/AcrR family transcriptional regulator [Castellaniella sp.]